MRKPSPAAADQKRLLSPTKRRRRGPYCRAPTRLGSGRTTCFNGTSWRPGGASITCMESERIVAPGDARLGAPVRTSRRTPLIGRAKGGRFAGAAGAGRGRRRHPRQAPDGCGRLLMNSFTDIVPLGYRCRITQRLRDHFGVSSAYPFDWWVSGMKGVSRVLRDWDVDRLFDPAELVEIRTDEGVACIRHESYGLKLQHDFPKKRGMIRWDWRKHLDEAKSRTGHLMRKFEALDDPARTVLFCREVAPFDKSLTSTAQVVKRLIEARLPQARTAFLLISSDGVEAPGWRSLKIDDPADEPWYGRAEIWDPALASLGFRYEPASEPLAEEA